MSRTYLKKATLTATSDAPDVHATVAEMLIKIESGGDKTAIEYATKLDKYDGPILLGAEEIAAAAAKVPQKLKVNPISATYKKPSSFLGTGM